MVRPLHLHICILNHKHRSYSGLLIAGLLFLAALQLLGNSAMETLCDLPVANRFCSSPKSLVLHSPGSVVPENVGVREVRSGIVLPDYGRLVSLQQTFEEILEPLSGGALALSLQFSGIVLQDLAITVECSDLPGKDDVTGHINYFNMEAEVTESGLRKLGSEVGSVVDRFDFLSLQSFFGKR